jgi:hypothetical protein
MFSFFRFSSQRSELNVFQTQLVSLFVTYTLFDRGLGKGMLDPWLIKKVLDFKLLFVPVLGVWRPKGLVPDLQ